MNEKEKLIPQRRFKEFKNTGTWEQRKLGDIAEIKTGPFGSTLHAEDYVQSGIPIITTEHFKSGHLPESKDGTPQVSDEDYSRLKSYILKKGDIVFSRVGSVDINALVTTLQDGWLFSGRVLRVRSQNQIDSDYLHYLLDTLPVKNDIVSRAVGQTMPSINTEILKSTKLVLSKNIEEQELIAGTLRKLDDTLALHQRKLEKTKALKSAYLSELFPVEGERKPKRRFAGFIDDWKQGTVGEYGYFYYGKSAPKWSVTKDAIIPCVRYGELYTKFGAKIDKVYSYTNISKENLKFSTGNEVLVPRVGEDPLDFANCSWLSIPNVAIGEMISVYNTEENPLFISYYFNSQLRHAFAKRVEGGNVSNLYFTYLENITISIPNKEEQDTIANFLESLDSVVEHHQHKLEKLKNIKQAYLNELFV